MPFCPLRACLFCAQYSCGSGPYMWEWYLWLDNFNGIFIFFVLAKPINFIILLYIPILVITKQTYYKISTMKCFCCNKYCLHIWTYWYICINTLLSKEGSHNGLLAKIDTDNLILNIPHVPQFMQQCRTCNTKNHKTKDFLYLNTIFEIEIQIFLKKCF